MSLFQEQMNTSRLVEIVSKRGEIIGRSGHVIEYRYRKCTCLLIYVGHADRMRLLCAVCPQSQLSKNQLSEALEANFHTSIDVRYALSEGALFSVFMHPISSLSEELFLSAMDQIVEARNNFGDSYSSCDEFFEGL